MSNKTKTHFALIDNYHQYLKVLIRQELTHIIFAVIICIITYFSVFTKPSYIYASTIKPVSNGLEQNEAEYILTQYSDNLLHAFEQNQPDKEEILQNQKIQYNSDVNWYLYQGYYTVNSLPASKAWSHALNLYNSGLIHGSTTSYQCTLFAQMWFYDVYGFNSSGYGPTGNGDTFALKVYETAVYYDENGELHHLFKLDDHPESMGIVSISSSSPHVLCVDEVNYQNSTITISDGNVNGSGDVRIRVTYSLSEFYAVNPGSYIFANPTQVLLEMLRKG